MKHISEDAGLSSNWLVYDFKRVQFPRNLIDIALYENRLYYVLGDGQLKVNAIDSAFKKINDVAAHKTSEANIAKGNIVILPNASHYYPQVAHSLALQTLFLTISKAYPLGCSPVLPIPVVDSSRRCF